MHLLCFLIVCFGRLWKVFRSVCCIAAFLDLFRFSLVLLFLFPCFLINELIADGTYFPGFEQLLKPLSTLRPVVARRVEHITLVKEGAEALARVQAAQSTQPAVLDQLRSLMGTSAANGAPPNVGNQNVSRLQEEVTDLRANVSSMESKLEALSQQQEQMSRSLDAFLAVAGPLLTQQSNMASVAVSAQQISAAGVESTAASSSNEALVGRRTATTPRATSRRKRRQTTSYRSRSSPPPTRRRLAKRLTSTVVLDESDDDDLFVPSSPSSPDNSVKESGGVSTDDDIEITAVSSTATPKMSAGRSDTSTAPITPTAMSLLPVQSPLMTPRQRITEEMQMSLTTQSLALSSPSFVSAQFDSILTLFTNADGAALKAGLSLPLYNVLIDVGSPLRIELRSQQRWNEIARMLARPNESVKIPLTISSIDARLSKGRDLARVLLFVWHCAVAHNAVRCGCSVSSRFSDVVHNALSSLGVAVRTPPGISAEEGLLACINAHGLFPVQPAAAQPLCDIVVAHVTPNSVGARQPLRPPFKAVPTRATKLLVNVNEDGANSPVMTEVDLDRLSEAPLQTHYDDSHFIFSLLSAMVRFGVPEIGLVQRWLTIALQNNEQKVAQLKQLLEQKEEQNKVLRMSVCLCLFCGTDASQTQFLTRLYRIFFRSTTAAVGNESY